LIIAELLLSLMLYFLDHGILVHPLQFDMDIQAHFPPALAALHNFIRKHNPDDIADFNNVEDPQPGACAGGPAAVEEGQLAEGLPRAAERRQTNETGYDCTGDVGTILSRTCST
jgi:hypothetical protein